MKTYGKLRVPAGLKNRARQKILTSLEPWRLITSQRGEQYTVPLSSATTGGGCTYFAPFAYLPATGAANGTLGVTDACTLCEVADKIGFVGPPFNVRFHVSEMEINYNFTNPNNSKLQMIAYYCIARRDVPSLYSYNNIISLLGDGFEANGLGTGNGGGNTHLSRLESTPYQSTTFCHFLNIYKTQKITFDAGSIINLHLKTKRMRYFNMSNLIDPRTAGTTYLGATRIVDVPKGTRFILFKIFGQVANQTAANSANIVWTDPKVDLVVVRRLRYRRSIDDRPSTFVDSVSNMFTATDATTAIIDEETDAVDVVKDAR